MRVRQLLAWRDCLFAVDEEGDLWVAVKDEDVQVGSPEKVPTVAWERVEFLHAVTGLPLQ